MNENHDHLHRLERVWSATPIYFVTPCTAGRVERLATDAFHSIAVEVWATCSRLHDWQVGRYVIMSDHVHFFCYAGRDARPLSLFVGKWKEWTAKYAARRLSTVLPLWQPEFFDHLLRSSEGYGHKWEYVRNNPVRAGLVTSPDAWQFQGELCELRFE